MNILKIKSIAAITAVIAAFISVPVQAEQVGNLHIGYVYQVHNEDSFDIHLPERPNDCGSSLYRVRDASPVILERKFAIAMAALLSDKRIRFNETDTCDGNRMLVSWIRILRN